MYRHILLPTDGSDIARKGIDQGLSLAKVLGSRVTVLVATEPFPRSLGATDGWVPTAKDVSSYRADHEAHAQQILNEIKSEAEAVGVPAETLHVSDGHAATAILEQAEVLGCDLIIMSSHGRRGLSRLFLGSQTNEVVSHSKVPVLVIR